MFKYVPNNTGINFESPTMQNMMQQNPYSIAPNIGNIGGLGYNNNQYMNPPNMNQIMNGGYYSGYYNYNPQELMRQMEEQRKAEEEAIKNAVNIQILRNKIYNNFNGIKTDEEYLEKFYNPNTYVEIHKDLNDYEEARRLSEIANDPNRRIDGTNQIAIDNMARISSQIRSNHPVDQSFEDFFNTAGDLYCEAIVNENNRLMRQNIGNTYNREAFSQLANMHQSSFASLRQATSVDDLSIALPAHLQRSNEYQQRKNEFLNYITQNDVRNRGGI